jgi:hypothetical protein
MEPRELLAFGLVVASYVPAGNAESACIVRQGVYQSRQSLMSNVSPTKLRTAQGAWQRHGKIEGIYFVNARDAAAWSVGTGGF